LDSAKAVLVVLGPGWVRVSDEWGQRRIDQEDDWVRKEIEQALTQHKEVIPVVVDGARIPPAEKLPKSISDLANRQAIEIRTTYWDHDMKLLLSRLESLAETPPVQESAGLYPIPPPEKPDPISDESLEIALKGTYRSGGRLLASYPKRPIPSERNYFVNTSSRPSEMQSAS
jgi:hypothetical protein